MPAEPAPGLELASARGRWTMFATILGSAMVFLDGTVVNVALPRIGRELDTGIAGLQWVTNGYMLMLAALILLGGALGDRYGRKRVFTIGVVWFTVASVVCAAAPSIEWLVAARMLQGVGGALLTPGSLALIEASFRRADRGRAIGLWSGLAGVSTAFGPALGGYLVGAVGWRSIFVLNVPLGLATLAVTLRHVPESRSERERGRLDVFGAALATFGLAGATYALIESERFAQQPAAVLAAAVVGVVALPLFVWRELRAEDPMLPLGIFRSRDLVGANLVTFVVYGGFSGMLLMFNLFLQAGLGYSPVAAGAATIPITLVMLTLSPTSGALAGRYGPRVMLAAGPAVIGVAMLAMTSLGAGSGYVTAVLPLLLLFSLGLVITVAPVTTTALATAPTDSAGVASAVNNAVARTGSLIVVAVLPSAVGLVGQEYSIAGPVTGAFHSSMVVSALLCFAGTAFALALIGRHALDAKPDQTTPSDPGCLTSPEAHLDRVTSRA